MSIYLPNKVIAIDLETTGLNGTYDYINQIGAAVMEDGGVVGPPFYSWVQPNISKLSIKGEALAKQCGDLGSEEGSKRAVQWFQDMASWPSAKDVATEFVKWVMDYADLPIIAHNASFDNSFLSSWFFQQRACFKLCQHIGHTTICTMQLAKRAWPGGSSYGLDEILSICGLEKRPENHDALQDAILAGSVYFEARKTLLNAKRN